MLDQIFSEDCEYIIKNTNLKKIKNTKVLILGSNGFLATYIQAVLLLQKCKITSISLNNPRGITKYLRSKNKINFLKMDLNDEYKLKKILNKNFDYIFHCATYGQPKKWQNNIFNTINLNTKILKLVLEHSVKFKSRVLYFSSAAVYKISNFNDKKKEDSPLSIGNFFYENVYSTSKILGEKLCEFYKDKYKIPVFVVRPAHTFGPGQDFNFDDRVLPQLIKRALIEKKIYIHDSGLTVRSWTYISDVTIMILNIIQRGNSLIYNVCGKESKSIYEIAKHISSLEKINKIEIRKKRLVFTNVNHNKLVLSSKKYDKEFNKKNYIKFTDGLIRFIKWNKEWQK
ncbi:NAD(P)-dependent oxidoreductase [Candidatus Pelagibacter sp.]|nr:NAD(P)-dependent oxidoreductase [Candidatus Pelagibacter sp.]